MTPEEVRETLLSFNSFHPLGKNGKAEDVARAIVYLAGAQSGYITGVTFPVDGGVLAGRS